MKKLFLSAALLLLPLVSHATISELTDVTSPITVGGVHVDDIVTFSPSPADRIWWSDDAAADFNPQSAENVELVIEGLYGTAIDISLVQELDGLTGAGTSHSGDPFNFFAAHYDNKEFVFYFETAITDFTIGDLGQDISNWRTYSCVEGCGGATGGGDPDPVSAPGTMALLSLGLLSLYRARRTR